MYLRRQRSSALSFYSDGASGGVCFVLLLSEAKVGGGGQFTAYLAILRVQWTQPRNIRARVGGCWSSKQGISHRITATWGMLVVPSDPSLAPW